jgi:hypothetical protein
MKKIIFFAVLLLSVSISNAQLHFGVKAGYNSSLTLQSMSSVTNGGYNANSVKNEIWNNFHAGVFARLGIGPIYFQPELLYSMQKTDYKTNIIDAAQGTYDLQKYVSISTVDVPLLIGYKLLDLKLINLRVFAGPKLRFDAGSSLRYENLTGGTFNTNSVLSEAKKSKIGLEAGVGVDVLMLALDFRYNMIGNMYETKLTDYNLPASTFVISLGWKIF